MKSIHYKVVFILCLLIGSLVVIVIESKPPGGCVYTSECRRFFDSFFPGGLSSDGVKYNKQENFIGEGFTEGRTVEVYEKGRRILTLFSFTRNCGRPYKMQLEGLGFPAEGRSDAKDKVLSEKLTASIDDKCVPLGNEMLSKYYSTLFLTSVGAGKNHKKSANAAR